MGIFNRVRDYVVEVSGVGREILELEAMLENKEFDLKRLTAQKIDVDKIRKKHLAVILTGKSSPLDKDEIDALGINNALVETQREQFKEMERVGKGYDTLRTKYFGYVADRVCEEEGVRGIPVMVYFNSNIICANKKFKRKFDLGSLNAKLKVDDGLKVALEKRGNYEVGLGKGKLVFLFPKKKVDSVGVAYFLPEDSRLEKMAGVVKKRSEKAVKKVYEELEGCLSTKYRVAFG